jgi:hypothetical protein
VQTSGYIIIRRIEDGQAWVFQDPQKAAYWMWGRSGSHYEIYVGVTLIEPMAAEINGLAEQLKKGIEALK